MKFFKKIVKNSLKVRRAFAYLLYLYLRFVYYTTKWTYDMPDLDTLLELQKRQKTIWLTWHNQLAILPYFFKDVVMNHALVSPHRDGFIIAEILKNFKIDIISGSSNENAHSAIRQIFSLLNQGANIGITPDGPRGPKNSINSNITRIAIKAKADIIPVAAAISRYRCFNSWDQFIFPLPFGKGIISIGLPVKFREDQTDDESNMLLKKELDELEYKSRKNIEML